MNNCRNFRLIGGPLAFVLVSGCAKDYMSGYVPNHHERSMARAIDPSDVRFVTMERMNLDVVSGKRGSSEQKRQIVTDLRVIHEMLDAFAASQRRPDYQSEPGDNGESWVDFHLKSKAEPERFYVAMDDLLNQHGPAVARIMERYKQRG